MLDESKSTDSLADYRILTVRRYSLEDLDNYGNKSGITITFEESEIGIFISEENLEKFGITDGIYEEDKIAIKGKNGNSDQNICDMSMIEDIKLL